MATAPPKKITNYEKLLAQICQNCGGRVHGSQLIRKSYEILCEMMFDRDYRIVESCESEAKLSTAIEQSAPVLRSVRSGAPDIVCFYDHEDRTSIKLLRHLRQQFEDEEIIIVSTSGPTPFTRRDVGSDSSVSFFLVRELLMNPTRHELVPVHRGLTTEEGDDVAKRLCILPHQFAILTYQDIVRRWMKFERNQIVEITRKGFGNEECKFYRRVI